MGFGVLEFRTLRFGTCGFGTVALQAYVSVHHAPPVDRYLEALSLQILEVLLLLQRLPILLLS